MTLQFLLKTSHLLRTTKFYFWTFRASWTFFRIFYSWWLRGKFSQSRRKIWVQRMFSTRSNTFSKRYRNIYVKRLTVTPKTRRGLTCVRTMSWQGWRTNSSSFIWFLLSKTFPFQVWSLLLNLHWVSLNKSFPWDQELVLHGFDFKVSPQNLWEPHSQSDWISMDSWAFSFGTQL